MSDTHTTPDTTSRPVKNHRGGSAGVWITLVLTVLILVALIIFIAQNSQRVELHYLSANTTIGFGIAMLLAAVAGALIAALVASMLKIRRALRSKS